MWPISTKWLAVRFNSLFLFCTCCLLASIWASDAEAASDDYVGDSAIYGGATAMVRPNVLVILDTSGSMNDTIEVTLSEDSDDVDTYDPDLNYRDIDICGSDGDDKCRRDRIYECRDWGNTRCEKWLSTGEDVNDLDSSCGNGPGALASEGIWQTSEYDIENGGSCSTVSWSNNTFATGNYINWQSGGGSAGETVVRIAKIEIAKDVISDLIANTPGIDFGLMKFHYKSNASPESEVAKGAEFVADAGYETSIRDLDAYHVPPLTNREKFLEVIDRITAEGWTPLAESLYEAGRYFRGESSAFHSGVDYTSPISARCQANYIILVTDGMSRHDRHSVLAENVGDWDNDNFEPDNDPAKDYGSYEEEEMYGSDYLDDVAEYLFENDHSDLEGVQNVMTYTLGFGEVGGDAGAVKLLNETIFNGTGGARNEAYLAMDMADLRAAFKDILTEIKKANTAFAAPVVPTDPQNRYASGKRVYLGLFQPTKDGRWYGNLKKYGLNADGQILGSDDATIAVDAEGQIKENATSFWSGAADGREVRSGGAGELLLARDFSSSDPANGKRRIYTNITTNPYLNDVGNAFAVGNNNLAPVFPELGDAERTNLINFVHGVDVFDDDDDGNTGDKRPWILGDVLHAPPVVVHYDDYTFNLSNEADPSINKTLIFVASNDGQLHVFRDADGTELWSFIPDMVLSDLSELRNGQHTYLVDMAPSVFIFDPGQDGPSDSGDKVLLVFGLRRGGGKDALLANQKRGAYYALDVSVPDSPKLLWKLTKDETGFAEMGESWSPPILVRMKAQEDGSFKDMILAVFGAGYDNNEDLRFGNTQGFSVTEDTTDTSQATDDAGDVTSAGDGAQHNPRGRGLFAVKVGEFGHASEGANFTPASGVSKIWGRSVADETGMSFGISAEVAALDINHDGYVDRFYVGDTGGQLWRVDAGEANPANWEVGLIFQANGGTSTTMGRKFFYRPSVTVERDGRPIIFIGSGDRAHPLNEGVEDRLYAIKDPAALASWDGSALTEDDLVDVTENILQIDSLSELEQVPSGISTLDEAINQVLVDLHDKSGWFIRLDQNSGEKVLASPLVFNRAAYFTTFTPEAPVSDDPCDTGNLGVARVYVVDYLTGEALLNYDENNDIAKDEVVNERALNRDEKVLRRSDRVRTIGTGIPTEAKVIMTDGDAKVVTGSDGDIDIEDPLPGGGIHPLYWLQR